MVASVDDVLADERGDLFEFRGREKEPST